MDKRSQLYKPIFNILLLVGLALAIMSCNSAQEPTSATQPDPMENWENFDAIVATVEPTPVPIAVVPPPTPTKVPSPTPPPAILAPDDGCVTCHTDQAMLQETAKEEEVVEVLSEGEG